MFNFENKVVLITGGSRGLGKAMSEGFALAGAKVVIASRKLESCQALAADIINQGGDALAVAANTGNTDDLDRLVETAINHYGRVDIVINNAGINIAMGALTDQTPAAFDKMYQVNQRGPWYLATKLAPYMAENGGGAIINILSVAGLRPPAFMGFYAATKAALEALTKVMAQEWAPMNIRVNAIAPGSYHSDLTDGVIDAIPGMEDGMLEANLIKRIADSKEILNPVFYLAGESYTTGITLTADGGMLAK
ncbi:SDR family NAD(P)-dependent oxidoreductase [Oceanicoccus sp. KOV_DT_Chl]|uniref:SDR family NAD(P)-dependent oxidoreductase n=1 Tax=Oceanicoccus sp. KOV_DT_Chl TaxID=1904639 RepID=UPI000C79ADF6|nr:glucose 1-dehydrogenase [Oceanicoccus sp. KOV_DT_Chl]